MAYKALSTNDPYWISKTSTSNTISTVYSPAPTPASLPHEIYGLLKEKKFKITNFQSKIENKNITELAWALSVDPGGPQHIGLIFNLSKGKDCFAINGESIHFSSSILLSFDSYEIEIIYDTLKTAIPKEYQTLMADSALNDFPALTYLVET